MDPLSVYNENYGNSHEAAVQAVYDAGLADGLEKAASAFLSQNEAIPTLTDKVSQDPTK